MEKRVLLAVALCVAIFAGWQKFYLDPILKAQQEFQKNQTVADKTGGGGQTSQTKSDASIQPSKVESVASAQEQRVTLATSRSSWTISSFGGVVVDQQFPTFGGTKLDRIQELVGVRQGLVLNFKDQAYADLSKAPYRVVSQSEKALQLGYADSRVRIERSYKLDEFTDSLDVDTKIQFVGATKPTYVFLESEYPHLTTKVENEHRNVMIHKSGSNHTLAADDIKESKEESAGVNWIGLTSRYFINAVVDRSENGAMSLVRPGEGGFVAGLAYPVQGSEVWIQTRAFFGPKQIELLKKVSTRLGAAVDFGWFTVFAYPLLEGLKLFYRFLNNFGLAIILLTILVKVLTYPLTYKSMKSMKDMQKIQPQLNALKEKYANDKEALNREMLLLMRTQGYNPMSGCLPLFIQMPIYIALYNVLNHSIELYGQPFFGWIHDLSQKDPYYVTPVLLALVMFLQQKLTPNTSADPAQQKMMTFMPLMFGVMMLWLPSGLTLYMLVNSVVGVGQQVYMNRKFAS